VRRAVAVARAVLALAQVSLGVAAVLARALLDPVTLHRAGGAMLLASLALSWALAGPPAGDVTHPRSAGEAFDGATAVRARRSRAEVPP